METISFNQKILCIGANTEHTDTLTSELAKKSNTTNHGLVNDPLFVPTRPGYYHTTVVDLNEGQIDKIVGHFSSIVLLDQSQDIYDHYRVLLRTFRLLKTLEKQGTHIEYPTNNPDINRMQYWWNFLRTQPSVCFHPFLALVTDIGSSIICSKSEIPIKEVPTIENWQQDPDYRKLRDAMLRGEKLTKHCQECYDKEERDIESTRQFETLEWAVKLKLNSVEDLNQIQDPLYYEVRPSNKCNIMCRMCDDARSHLIEKEFIQLGIPLIPYRFKNISYDRINFDTVKRIYFGGGEPTIMPEFYEFLQLCISKGQTDFELCVGTNGMKFSNKILNLLSHFSNVLFSFSFDGYGIVNDYIRWKSDFETIRKNSRIVREQGHRIGLQTVFSLYNATSIHKIFEFYDEEFPGSSSLVQAAGGHDGCLLPWNHPKPDLVVASMKKAQKTNQYLLSGRSCQTYVDSMHDRYANPDYTCDIELLRKFFVYNDRLDQARGSRLIDYIPELDEGRKLLK